MPKLLSLGELTALPKPTSCIKRGPTSKGRERGGKRRGRGGKSRGERREEEGRGGEGRGGKGRGKLRPLSQIPGSAPA